MSDKTCGTCGHCTMIHDRYAAASCVCNITCMIDSGGHNCLRSVCPTTKPCGDYIERTDSLEDVALDAAKKHCCYCDYWDGTKREPVYDSCFADRLRALGVEVSQ